MPLSQALSPSLDYDVVIIGAGASGLMCAITAGQRGRRVLVIDHANKIGKKILISGGGRCNYTNMYVEPSCYLGSNEHFCKSALARYTQWDFQALVDKHQIPWHEKTLGQLFCDERSRDIVDLLVEECRQASVAIRLKTTLNELKTTTDGFVLKTSLGTVRSQSVVVATGGLSFPTMGATGLGYSLAEQFGHQLVSRTAGLVPFTLPKSWLEHFKALAGVSAEVVASCRGKAFKENILFTHRGVSGPVILQISSYWRPGDSVHINWLPDCDIEGWLSKKIKERPKAEFKTVLSEHLTKRLAQLLCEYGSLSERTERGQRLMSKLSTDDIKQVSSELQFWALCPSGTEGYKKAEVTLGGGQRSLFHQKPSRVNIRKGCTLLGKYWM